MKDWTDSASDVLPPIRNLAMDQPAPLHTSDMERRVSLSSGYTSSHSGYSPSRSVSPTALYSPGLDRNMASSVIFHQAHASLETGAARCTACLANGDHVIVQIGKACGECGTIANNHSRTRTSRRKRSDRRECLRLSADQKQDKKLTKEMVEAARRLQHTDKLGRMQQQQLDVNSNMPQEAAGGPWKPLKKNNMSVDCSHTLLYNKENVLSTQIILNEHYRQLLDDTVYTVTSIQIEAQSILQSGDAATFEAFVRRIAQDNLAQRITHSASTRGTNHFLRPSQLGQVPSRL